MYTFGLTSLPQELVYGRNEDAALRNAVRHGKTAAEFLAETSTLNDRWEKVKQHVEDEQFKGAAPPTRPRPITVRGGVTEGC